MKNLNGFCLGSTVVAAILALVPVAVMAQSNPQGNSGSGTMQGMKNGGDSAMQGMKNGADATGHKMDQGASKMMRSSDSMFAVKAAQGGMTEVKIGQLAADKASNPDVKAYGQQMVDDHTKANDQLKSIAQEEGMTLPTDVNAKQQAMYDNLSKMSGADFDKMYVKDMMTDHQQDVKDFSKESQNGKDEKIKGFAAQTLPIVQGH